MSNYLMKRGGLLILTLVVTSVIVFVIAQIIPGDICRVILGREAGEAAIESCRIDLGLHESAIQRYINWLSDFLKGDWGKSYSTDFEILPWVLGRLRNSIMLAVVTFSIAIPSAIVLGITAGINQNNWIDKIINFTTLAFVGLPEFVTGILLINFFAFRLDWFPANSSISIDTSFREALPSLYLPAITASIVLLAYIARLIRAETVEELKQDYVRTAELKGLPKTTVMFKHVLRNALMPSVTVIAISTGWLISGLIVIENVFNYPGIGRLMVFAIDRRDLPALQATVMITVVAFSFANLIADILYSAIDPRIKIDG